MRIFLINMKERLWEREGLAWSDRPGSALLDQAGRQASSHLSRPWALSLRKQKLVSYQAEHTHSVDPALDPHRGSPSGPKLQPHGLAGLGLCHPLYRRENQVQGRFAPGLLVRKLM